jgi:hypothetical protein
MIATVTNISAIKFSMKARHTVKRIFLTLAMATCCITAAKAQIVAGSLVSPADSFNAMLSGTENQMMTLVKAMPAEKYGFAPSPAIFVASQKTEYSGVRTFAALVLHVTEANYGMGARLGGMKPDVDVASLAGLKDKDQIVAALAASFAFVHKAIGTMTVDNAFQSLRGTTTRATLAGGNVVHTADEYGQMVEYLRMSGVIPPSSAPPAPPKAK